MSGTLDGKVAIVTGAGRGLGRVMTLGLLAAGARVAAIELDAEALDDTRDAAEKDGAGDRILDIVADVTRDDSAPKIVRATTERFGRLDILLNNAGINMSMYQDPSAKNPGKFWDVKPEQFRRLIEVNVIAAFLMTRAALGPMLNQRWGRIINVTTSLDTMYRAGIQPYGGSKAANEAHLLALAQELEGTGVTANVLVPGGRRRHAHGSARPGVRPYEADSAGRNGGAACLAVLERLRRHHRPALHRHALGQESGACRGGEKSRRAGSMATARPPGDHAEEVICIAIIYCPKFPHHSAVSLSLIGNRAL
jgi:NAD(P)-dependent dehydrogenase (short-subunit alcohol dehydrogenase family)